MQHIDDRVLLASDNNGLWLSNQSLRQWTQIGGDLPGNKLNALLVQEDMVFVSVYRKGIFVSSDKGENWRSLNADLPELKVQAILAIGDTIFAGTDQGIFYRQFEAKKWVSVVQGPQILSLQSWNGKILAGSSQGALLSGDNGLTWEWIHQEGAIHYTEVIEGKIVLLYVHGDVFVSDDEGQSWTEAIYEPRKDSYSYDVVQQGAYMILSNNYGIHRSIDGGKNWALIYPTEKMAFFEFLKRGDLILGGTRHWDEFRGR
ncbi:MAG: hypothetical protein AAF206_10895 [Bacteroidota bacterium]